MSEIDSSSNEYNAVEPPHYKRGPIITRDIGEAITKGKSVFQFSIQCIEVMRHIKDPRLATAFKYLWRVAFGGKTDPNYIATQQEVDERDWSEIENLEKGGPIAIADYFIHNDRDVAWLHNQLHDVLKHCEFVD